MLGSLFYFATALGIVFPVALSVVDGKTPWAGLFTPAFLGPPGFLAVAAFFSVFTPRFAGCLAFAGCVSCWIASGENVVRSIIALIAPQNMEALTAMDKHALLRYGAGWLPTLALFLTTFYSVYRALKIPREYHDEDATAGAPAPQ